MAGTLHRRIWVLCGATAAAAAVQAWVPGTGVDRAVFSWTMRAFANPPFFVAGEGSHQWPWSLRTLATVPASDKRQAPAVVAIGDDPDGVFQSSPPSPIDMAVVFGNFQRVGAGDKAASAVVMAWDAPDVMGMAALDKTLGRFGSFVAAVPMSRGAVPEPVPPAVRRASLGLADVRGDTARLPVVNRIPVRGAILGGDNAWAGFQLLESEPAADPAPLLARWDDRVVLAFPLLCVLQRLDLQPGDLRIRLGEAMQLGPDGPVVPIDAYGGLAAPLREVPPAAVIPAETLIDANPDILPVKAPPPWILRDERSGAEPATRMYSHKIAAWVAALSSDAMLAAPRAFHRWPAAGEWLMMIGVVLAAVVICPRPSATRHLGCGLLAAACVVAQLLAAEIAGVWLPGLAALAALAAACVTCGLAPVARDRPNTGLPHAGRPKSRVKPPVISAPAPPPHATARHEQTAPRLSPAPTPPARKSQAAHKKNGRKPRR